MIFFTWYYSFGQKNQNLYRIDSLKRTILDLKPSDSSSIADINYSIGDLYRKKTRFTDSAFIYYYNAEKIYRQIGNNFKLAKALYGISVILKNEKEFTESEVISVQILTILESLEQNNAVLELKSYVYNNLGIVFKELDEFNEAVTYHKESLKLKKKIDIKNKELIVNSSIINLANTYKKAGKYKLAISYYEQILNNKNLINKYPYVYSLVLDNYAHTLYLAEELDELPKLYIEALRVSESISSQGYNSIIINQHLAEYYHDHKNKDSALYYGYKAKEISEEYHNDDLLKSLVLLSKIEDDSMALVHSHAYIKLNDSLQKNERTIRDKFARIRFETQQIEQENIRIAKERMWLLIISVVLIISTFLLYMVITQRNKNKELKFIQKQQETNEEIYNLMLSQNESIEEARTLEKKRISEELHDGVLGRLFGTRLNLDSLNMSNSEEAIKTRGQYIDELKIIEQDIRKVSHELNTDFVSGSGFIDIIKTFLETQTAAYKLSYNLEHDDTIHWDEVPNKNKIHIYRIIQEALHNIHKHANATEVNISFKLKNNVICLIMSDDGSGFDVNKAKSGIGRKNMNSRISDINGSINIISKKDVGTTVTIYAPIT
ncbi:tetratricopeptide repeat-containing sensor histidine kinase [Flavivirga rizhaonensis]|uniref:histidine kinase n=1 Tax=Flavivirga rizhaonensis TaxID=2559571 RepID=A0A4S1E129_9FLAO|nr:tetratricopeptide repeat-containing sensor histidine kinase [Flavivirga rizhaonensis]TGV04230.1 tetratricopeptide repeat-containing sensor histidine kinase [Flavivirga rizhaonensis]